MSLKSGKFKVIGGRGVPDGIQLREPQVWKREGGREGGREGACAINFLDTTMTRSRTDFDDITSNFHNTIYSYRVQLNGH